MDNTGDHNREEASKAKKIALEKMENNDFRDAQQIILDAQKLCPELAESMSQMLIICRIHCAAESVVGGEKDLYGILQVEQTADETMISKQFRKIALSTHPDKSSIPGAQDAFKLVAEAHAVLSNLARRIEHDCKRKYGSAKEANDKKQKPPNRTDADEGSDMSASSCPTFWTRCPHCKCQFQYFKNIMHRKVVCHMCKGRFTAHPVEDQEGMPAEPTEHEWKRKNGSQDVPEEATKEPSDESDADEGSEMSGSSPTFWTRCPHCQYPYPYYIEALNAKVICQRCRKMYTAELIEDSEEPMPTSSGVCSDFDSQVSESISQEQQHDTPRRTSSSLSGNSQVSESMSQEQQHDTPSRQEGHPVNFKSSSASEGHRSAGGGVKISNEPEMVIKGKTRISETDKNTVGGSMADTADSNLVHQNKLGRKQASTVQGSGSYSLGGSSDRRTQHVDDNKISQNNSDDGKNRERENDYSCNISMNCNQILEGDITSTDRQSSQNHVSSKINVQEKTKGMCMSDYEDNIMKEAIIGSVVVEERPCYSDPILGGDITSADRQSSQNLVSSKDKTKGMCTSDEDNVDKETIDSVVLEKSSCCSDPVINIRDINRLTYNDGGVDQIWALYDNIDHMPRAYAMIKCVGHWKCLYWLKFYPLSEEEKEWNNKSLPVACGKFCLGEKVNILDYSSLYSHTVEGKQIYVKKVSGTKGYAKNKTMVYEIYPKRGEVWAIYKGWSKQWTSGGADQNRSYEYEVVEVLSDMSDNDGANVIPLIRIMGFPSLLVAVKDKSSFHIPSSEVFRFSHQIPHYRVSGHENILKKINGPTLDKNPIVPEGFLLLNSSCLPSNLDATFPSMNLDTYMAQSKKRSRNECQYEILPQVGEIWAIFMDWAPEQSPSTSNDCSEFAVGEIIERNDTSTKFSFLAKVDGCTAAFKPDKQKGVLEIPIGEKLRFSHHIPASFRVMKEKGGKRRVFYDLDPAYLFTVTAQDHATSSGNRSSTVEDPAKKQKTATAAQVGPRRTARPTRPNNRYVGPQWK